MDGLGGLWFQGKLNGKVGSAFAGSAQLHGGNEATVLSLWAPLAHLGFIIVPTGYADPRDVRRRRVALWRVGHLRQPAFGPDRSRTGGRAVPGQARDPGGKKTRSAS